MGADGLAKDGQFRISDMGPEGNVDYGAFDPSVTHNSATNEYLVSWSGDDNTPPLVSGEFEIYARRLKGGVPAGGSGGY